MANRGERKDDKAPEKYEGSGATAKSIVDKIAEAIAGSGLVGEAKKKIEEVERKRRDI